MSRSTRANPIEGNRQYQRRLALSLVASLGYEHALETCHGNGWDGLAQVLLTEWRAR